MKIKKELTFPLLGFIVANDTKKVIPVRVDKCFVTTSKSNWLPYCVEALDGSIAPFGVVNVGDIKLYSSPIKAEKAALKRVMIDYSAERSNLFKQQQKTKWALRRLEYFKIYGELDVHFIFEKA